MKKLILIVLTLFTGIGVGTANATWYLAAAKHGGIDIKNTQYPLTDTGTGKDFTITLDMLEEGENFKFHDGKNWENGYGGKDEKTTFALGAQYELKSGSTAKSIYTPFTLYNVTITLHIGNTFWFTVGIPTPYIIGDWDSGQNPTWNALSGIKMQPEDEDGNIWSGKISTTRSGTGYNYFRFLIQDKQYGPDDSLGDHVNLDLDREYTAFKGNKAKTFRINQAGDFYITLYLHGDDNPKFRISDKPNVLPVVTYRVAESAGAWSSTGIEFADVITFQGGETAIKPELISAIFEPGTSDESHWQTGDGRPDHLYDEEWNEWQAIEGADSRVDGYWDPAKVAANLDYSATDDDAYTLRALLPCSGKYRVTLISEYYDLRPSEDGDFFLTVYPSTQNLWTSDVYRDDEGTLKPLCLNINGVTMNTSHDNTDFSGWYMEYPFVEIDEADGGGKKIFNYETLDNSVVYVPGVYFGDMWIKTEKVVAEPETTVSPRGNRVAPISDGYVQGNRVDLSALATADGTQPGSNIKISILLGKNGAVMPLEADGSSAESFIITPSLSAPLPTAVDTIEDNDTTTDAYYTLQGVRTDNPAHGVYIRIRNGKATKIIL